MQESSILQTNVQLSSSQSKYVSSFIDRLIKVKDSIGETDLSDGIARVFCAKSCIDSIHTIDSVINECMLEIIKLNIVKANGKDCVVIEDVFEAMSNVADPAKEILNEKIDELEAEMQWVEVSKFKELCGE